MTRNKQRELLASICDSMKDSLLRNADKWPEHWDGHELRALVANDAAQQVPPTMSDKRTKRRRDFENDCAVLRI